MIEFINKCKKVTSKKLPCWMVALRRQASVFNVCIIHLQRKLHLNAQPYSVFVIKAVSVILFHNSSLSYELRVFHSLAIAVVAFSPNRFSFITRIILEQFSWLLFLYDCFNKIIYFMCHEIQWYEFLTTRWYRFDNPHIKKTIISINDVHWLNSIFILTNLVSN